MYRSKRRRLYAKNPINHLFVFETWHWTCSICGGIIDSSLRFPNPEAATIEHVIPLSRGGTHDLENVRPAHAYCNFNKGNLVPEEYASIRLTNSSTMDDSRNSPAKNIRPKQQTTNH